jgi:outer membrane immunogenic protein
MHVTKKLLLGVTSVASLLFMAECASADGLPYGRGIKDVGCPRLFHGFYVGAHGGYAMYTAHQNDQDAYFINPAGRTASDNGFTGGVQVGFNWQKSCHTLWGIEADWSWANVDATTHIFPNIPGINFRMTSSIDGIGTVRARTGVVLDNLLLYVTGGFAFADVDFRTRFAVGAVDERLSSSDTRVGWTAGVGTEWALSSNVSLKSEALYMNFGDDSHTFRSPIQARNVAFTTTDSAWVTRLGLNVRFGCGSWC